MRPVGSAAACRSCGSALDAPILDLGSQPVADILVGPEDPAPDPVHPLRVSVCHECLLVQLTDPEIPPTAMHGHGAAYSPTMREHLGAWAGQLIAEHAIGPANLVIDVSAGEGLLLAPFAAAGARVVALETDDRLADASIAAGLPTRRARIGRETAASLVADNGRADLVLVNHALAHADSLDDALAGLALLLAPDGAMAVEAHHVRGLVTGGQFDIVCHAHRSYLSLLALERALLRHDLVVEDARSIELHGGSMSLIVRRARDIPRGARRQSGRPGVAEVRGMEQRAGLDRVGTYRGLGPRAELACTALRGFLESCRDTGLAVAAYGAPTRGTTLLNAAGVTSALLPFTVDRSPAKQSRLLPGCRIPIRPPAAIDVARPDRVVILPWALRAEIASQLSNVRDWGGRFVVALPELRVLD